MKKLIALGLAMFIVPAFVAGAADAKATYEKDCSKCHGKDGKGDTKSHPGRKTYVVGKIGLTHDDGRPVGHQKERTCRNEEHSGHTGVPCPHESRKTRDQQGTSDNNNPDVAEAIREAAAQQVAEDTGNRK